MKTKGYVSAIALLLSILIFSIITIILIGVDFDIKTNKNEKDYYQNCLISESIANKIRYDEEIIHSLNIIFENMGIELKDYDIYYDELNAGGKTKLKIEKTKNGIIKINYKIKYNNTITYSTIFFLEKEIIEEELEEEIDEEIVEETEVVEEIIEESEVVEDIIEDKENEKSVKKIYEFNKYWIN